MCRKGVIALLLVCAAPLLPFSIIAQEPIPTTHDVALNLPPQPNFDWHIEYYGVVLDARVGIAIEEHHLLFTTFVEILTDTPDAPFPIPFGLGIQWRYHAVSVWPQYSHWLPLLGADFLIEDSGQGINVGMGWSINNETLNMLIVNDIFFGVVNIANLTQEYSIYDKLILSIALFRSSPIYRAHAIYAVADVGILSLMESQKLAYGVGLSIPMNFWDATLFVVPSFHYANQGGNTDLDLSSAVGFNFSRFSTFDRGAVYSSGKTASENRLVDGNVVFALKIEGRWYFLETLYLPFVSAMHLKAFTDLAYLAHDTLPLNDGRFLATFGGGIGFDFFGGGVSVNILTGYELAVGARFIFSIVGRLN